MFVARVDSRMNLSFLLCVLLVGTAESQGDFHVHHSKHDGCKDVGVDCQHVARQGGAQPTLNPWDCLRTLFIHSLSALIIIRAGVHAVHGESDGAV